MRSIKSALLWTFVGFFVAAAGAASSWNFEDASVSVQAKGSGGGEVKHKYAFFLRTCNCALAKSTSTEANDDGRCRLVGGKPLFQPISLTSSDTLRVVLTTVENGKAKRPHQAFLAITEPESRLEMSYPLKVMDSGKAKLEMVRPDLPPSRTVESAKSAPDPEGSTSATVDSITASRSPYLDRVVWIIETISDRCLYARVRGGCEYGNGGFHEAAPVWQA